MNRRQLIKSIFITPIIVATNSPRDGGKIKDLPFSVTHRFEPSFELSEEELFDSLPSADDIALRWVYKVVTRKHEV